MEPAARVEHAYEFAKGAAKWRRLERNRWATLIRTYPAALLALLAPALVATELALVPVSVAGGWLRQKLLAWGDTLRATGRLLRERRQIQAGRTIGTAEFARTFTADLASPYLGRAGTLARAARGAPRLLVRGADAARARGLRLSAARGLLRALEPRRRLRSTRPLSHARSSSSSRATSWARILVSSERREVAIEKCRSRTKATPKAAMNRKLAGTAMWSRSAAEASSWFQIASTSSATETSIQSSA